MRRRTFAIALLLGALAVPGFGLPGSVSLAVPPAQTWESLLALLPLLSIAGLLHPLRGVSVATAALTGGAWGLGFFLTGVSWVYVSLSQFSGLPMPVAALATLLFCAFLALYPALTCALYAGLGRHQGADSLSVRAVTLFAALWTLGEWLRGTLFTGFPWLSLGYAQIVPSPLAGYASVLGVYGVGFVSIGVAGCGLIAFSTAGAQRRRALVAALLILLAGGMLRAMDWVAPLGEPVAVRLLQGNIAQSMKWQPEQLQLSVDRYLGLLDQLSHDDKPEATLTVLPETSIPLLYDQIPPDILQALTSRGDTLLGVAVRTRDDGYANAAVAVARAQWQQPAGVYAKQHLVPFGEYSPPGFGWFFRWLRIPMSDFTAGPPAQAPLSLAGQKIAVNICYEDLFGEELLPTLGQASLLINLSNTAWFGDSLAQPQHLQIARMRALETGRVTLRATNSGMTAMIEPDGRISSVLAPFTAGVLRVRAQGYAGLTPYAKWGNALILIICFSILMIFLRSSTRANAPQD